MILTFDNYDFFVDFLRGVLASIDKLVFSLLGWIIEGIFNLSTLAVNVDFVQSIYKRIYIILAIFMVFKLTFSFLKYLVSPDAMTDKEQGVGKLAARVVTMVVMLIAFPILAFQPVKGMQNRTILQILQDGLVKTLPRIILGTKIDESNNSSSEIKAKSNGEQLALSMLKSFYYPSVCPGGAAEEEKYASECDSYFQGGSGSVEMEIDSKTLWKGGTGITEIKSLSDFEESVKEQLAKSSDKAYAWNYMWPLTTITGILLIVIMLGISIDVAVRVFKLMILQMMAPIPIMSYIDPKASKDGAFNAWLKSFVSTYIDLFVKLGTVYLILLLAQALFSDQLFAKTNFKGLSFLYVRVFLIIGLFQFAKSAPKFIKDALGIKDNGGGFMDSLKTLGAAAGLAGGTAIGAVGGLAGGAASGYAAARAAGNNKFISALKGAGKGLGGVVPGAVRGGYQGGKGAAKGNPFAGTAAALAAQNAVTQRKMTAAQNGSTFFGRMGARAEEFFTGQTAADRDKEQMEKYKEAIDGVKGFKEVLSDAANKSDAIIGGTNLKHFKGVLAAANAGDASAKQELVKFGFGRTVTSTTTDASGRTITTHTTVGDLVAANAGAAKFEKDWLSKYYGKVADGSINDGDAAAVISAKSVADAGIKGLGLSDGGTALTEVTADNAGKVIGAATSESNRIASSNTFKANRANAAAIKKNGR